MSRKNTQIIWIALLVSWIIIGVWVRRVFFRNIQQAPLAQQDEQDLLIDDAGQDTRYYIDQAVLLEGEITRSDDFSVYTHDFVDLDGNDFGLKSADIDLFAYQWVVSLKGTIIDITNSLPIVRVTEIVWRSEPQEALQPNDQFYYFKNAWVAIDLSIASWYEVEQQGSDILILDTAWSEQIETVLSITPFQCKSWDALRDCDSLLQNFELTWSDSFVSSNNITVYNLTETNTRLMFDNQWRWYYVKPRTPSDLTDFIDTIVFLNQEMIKSYVDNVAYDECKTIDYRLWDRSNVSLILESTWLITATVEAMTQQDDSIVLTCTFLIKPWLRLEHQLLSTTSTTDAWFAIEPFQGTPEIDEESLADIELTQDTSDDEVQDQPQQNLEETQPSRVQDSSILENNEESETIQDDQPLSDSVQDENSPMDDPQQQNASDIDESPSSWDSTDTQLQIPQQYADRLPFQSVRWYTAYFSSKRLAYAWGPVTWQYLLDIAWADCGYGIHITTRSNSWSVLESPDTIIYECNAPSDIDQTSLPNQATYLTERWDKHFIKKDYTSAFAGLEVAIE